MFEIKNICHPERAREARGNGWSTEKVWIPKKREGRRG